MKITKNSKLDLAYVKLKKGMVARTVELKPGILFDFDKYGEVLGIEVLSIQKVAPAIARKRAA